MYDAIYARQSVDRKDSVSIEAQIDYCKKYASNQHKIYCDKGFSGKSIDRPMASKLLDDIKSGLIHSVIVYRIDRISRNIVDFANLLSLFQEHNVKFVSATEQIDTSSPMGKAMVYIIMVFAQLERETIATRISDNYRFRCSTGKYFMGGNVPFGYESKRQCVDGKNASVLIPNDDAFLLKEIYKRFVEGWSITSIAKDLNESHLYRKCGVTWCSGSIVRILTNITPVKADQQLYEYLTMKGYNLTNSPDDFTGDFGMCIFLKTKNKNEQTDISEQIAVIGTHKPIIDSTYFIKTQFQLEENLKHTNKKRSRRSFLAGLIKCDGCNHSFGLKSTQVNDKKYAYYFCRGRGSRGQSTCNNDVYIDATELEMAILNSCKSHINKQLHIQIKLIKSLENKDTATSIKILESQIENLIANIGLGNTTIDKMLTKKIMQLQNQLDEIKNQKQPKSLKDDKITTFKNCIALFDDFDKLEIDFKINIMRKLIDYVLIDCNRNVKIKFLF